MPTPLPGKPVRGSTTGRPIMAAMDLLGRRWSLRLIWELRDGPVGARALLARCAGLSSSVLYQRLGELGASAAPSARPSSVSS
jgi:DNA-binding HxlR family transcriptional regulator